MMLLVWNPFSSSEAIGQRAPDFALHDTEGRTVQLSALHGKPVLLYFSTAWCITCRGETRRLARFYERYRDQVHVLWISFDPFNDSVEDLREHRRLYGHPDFRYALDSRTKPVAHLYRVQERGTMLLLSPQGEILFRGVRAIGDPKFLQRLHQALKSQI
ncbi:MAG: TlpA family protein disulfide reductase [Candidatus Bipolaricaulota bacterium]|nr:TlpA family protein disulfide reductase [Candidatus Bipolaricaulota bacterium]MCS7273910.1 TlpA family protein disulfide reductase [Candidatus Bipolaricaulota bacterium]MDW8110803.1 TlpA disulfide reductase family protein [Candidatus Bipolaricaulota bacterium]MDW8328716.1 TlpA disulfide reductase family protein [Candidatus Bipolaricaulota bacterium]